jgi:hypothetical protein
MKCTALQYRNDGAYGFWRHFSKLNASNPIKSLYMVESAVHEMMLQVRLCEGGADGVTSSSIMLSLHLQQSSKNLRHVGACTLACVCCAAVEP